MSSSSYNCKLPRGVMTVSASKPKPTKVIKTGSGSNFRGPSKSQVPDSSQGGSKK